MSRIADRMLDIATATVAICAVVLTVRTTTAKPQTAANGPPTKFREWDQIVGGGRAIGASNPLLKLVVFTDFECPYCKRFASVVESVRRAHPNNVEVTIRHFPLPSHKSAYGAARQAECALQQGRFWEMHDVLYKEQDSLAVLPPTKAAQLAGIPDVGRFESCARDTARVAAVERDMGLGRRFELRGTPTVFANGMRYPHPPDSVELEKLIARAKKS